MKSRTLYAVLALLGLTAVGLQACNTMEGAGQDLQKAGQGIENSADKNKTY